MGECVKRYETSQRCRSKLAVHDEESIMYVSNKEKHNNCHLISGPRTSIKGLREQGQVVGSARVKGDCQLVSWFECRPG